MIVETSAVLELLLLTDNRASEWSVVTSWGLSLVNDDCQLITNWHTALADSGYIHSELLTVNFATLAISKN